MKELIRILLELPLDKAKTANKDENNSGLISIESMFEKMKEASDNYTGGGGGSDDDDDDVPFDEDAVLKFAKKPAKNPANKSRKSQRSE